MSNYNKMALNDGIIIPHLVEMIKNFIYRLSIWSLFNEKMGMYRLRPYLR